MYVEYAYIFKIISAGVSRDNSKGANASRANGAEVYLLEVTYTSKWPQRQQYSSCIYIYVEYGSKRI